MQKQLPAQQGCRATRSAPCGKAHGMQDNAGRQHIAPDQPAVLMQAAQVQARSGGGHCVSAGTCEQT
jgi:hypothetical protein